MAKETLTANEKARINNIDMITGSIALLGAIGGVMYANKTGGGFWRYLGYWIVGGLATGLPARVVALPFKNAILRKGDIQTQKVELSENTLSKEVTSNVVGGKKRGRACTCADGITYYCQTTCNNCCSNTVF